MSERLFQTCKEAASKVGKNLGMGPDDIEDAAASVYLKCRDKTIGHESYVYTATRNWFIGVISKRENRKETSCSDFSRYGGVPVNHDDTNGYFDEAEIRMIKDCLFGKLTPGQQDALTVEWAGYEWKEACTLLGITLPAYKSALARGRRRLRQMLWEIKESKEKSKTKDSKRLQKPSYR